MKYLIVILAALLAVPMPMSATAAEVGGVSVPESVASLVPGTSLVLNGAGLRRRAFFRVYVAALYLPKKTADVTEVLSSPGPKRVAIQMLRDVSAAQFVEALNEGMRDNHSAADMKSFEARMNELSAVMDVLKEAKEGMRIVLDWVPGSGTIVTVDGTARGKPLAGEDFYRALLRIWLGDKPVQTDLKNAMLGAA